MTPEQIKIALSFNRITFLPGSWNKRFAHNMAYQAQNLPEKELTAGQEQWIYRILYTYRRQVPDVYEKYRDNVNCKKL